MKQKNDGVLLTEGPIAKRLVTFAIPMFLGNLFQQLYNTADSLIVGNFLDSYALASVSSSTNLIFLLVGFFNGIAMGGGVVVARHFGAKDYIRVEKAVHTMTAFGLISSIVLMIVGISFTPTILRLMGTPADVLPGSISYFQTYFLGSFGFVMYNIFVGIMQSIGDSRHPLYYLIISSITNVILDFLFVVIFHFGVESTALATAISQMLSAFLCFLRLTRCKEAYRINIRKIKIDFDILKHIIHNGLPAGCQNSIIGFANVVVQSNINQFGPAAMAGCGSYFKIEGFGFLPITCFAMSLTTFVSQNLGARQYERAKKGSIIGISISVTIASFIGLIIFTFAPQLISFFDKTPEVIAFGTKHARTVTLFYCILAFSHCMAGVLRGAGKAIIPMIVILICWCVIRITYMSVAVHIYHDILAVVSAYPFTWFLTTVIFLWFYLKTNWVGEMK